MGATRFDVLIDIFLYITALIPLRENLTTPGVQRKNNERLSFLCVLLFCLFAYWGGDYFHYQEGFDIVKNFPDAELSFEDIYYWIISLTPTYLTFRLVVWGGCLLLVYMSFKRLNIPIGVGILFFVSLSLMRISYARASLAMAIMSYGYVLFLLIEGSKIRQILSALIILSSFFFHKSAYFGIAMIVMSYFMLIMQNKKTGFLFLSLVFLGSFAIVSRYIDNFMILDSEDSALNIQVGQKYLGRDVGDASIGGLIRNYLEMVPYYMGLIIYFRLYKNRLLQEFPKPILAVIYFFLSIIIVATVFSFNFGGLNTQFLYRRFMRFNLIPTAIFLSYCYAYDFERKWCKSTLYVGIIVSLYTLFYSYHVS